jgi:hypothetical protein
MRLSEEVNKEFKDDTDDLSLARKCSHFLWDLNLSTIVSGKPHFLQCPYENSIFPATLCGSTAKRFRSSSLIRSVLSDSCFEAVYPNYGDPRYEV